jgi:glycerophosphoryl diester phosphodiesterase
MLLIAHRGGTDRFPELTIEAAQFSLTLGADYVELDIRFTKDEVPVIAHDEDCLRLFGIATKVSEMRAEQFLALRYPREDTDSRPCSLEEVLASGVAPVLFHIKEGGEQLLRILSLIMTYGYEDKVVIGVTTCEDVQDVKQFDERIQVLAFMRNKELAPAFIDCGADIIRLWERWVDEASVELVHQLGRQVWVMAGYKATTGYTTPDNITAWKHIGIDGVLLDEVEKNKPYM